MASAQLSNLHTRKIKASGLILLDKQCVVPNSVEIKGIDTNYFSVDYVKATILWHKSPSSDSVQVTYRTFSFSFSTPVHRFSYDSISNNFLVKQSNLFNRNIGNQENSLFNFGNGITYNGSIGRSITVGNTQNAVFNSQLNLQLSGYIGDSVQMSVALTDNNIPLQPDGSTQQLNEFDKLLLQFKKKDWELNMGDIDIRQNKNYFLNFYKRIQGASFAQQSTWGNAGSNKILMSGAIARGKFARNSFTGQDGNQGPYKLQGANSELYLVVLANTEHVFIDGEVLQRGEDQDYTINYNTAEITFTPKRMITANRRIQVEFEYSDQNYLSTLLYVNDELKLNKRLTMNVSVYDNSDAKRSQINQSLDSSQIHFLANLGDSVQNAYYPNAALDTFSTTRIMYAKVALPNGKDSIYYYSVNPDSAKYVLNFLLVGANKGNYVPYYNGANGNVYQYVTPINGVPQGNYEPAIFLVTPKKRQVVNFSSTYQIDNKNTLQTDLAVSNFNRNTFSSLQKNNDVGMAGRVQLIHADKLKFKGKILTYNSTIGYEQVDENFAPVERLRQVEFYRDWGLPIITTNATERLPSVGVELKDSNNNAFKYTASGYFRSDNYKGFRQSMQDVQAYKGWGLKSDVSLLNNEAQGGKGYYFRPSFDLNKVISKLNQLTIGGGYALEQNEQHIAGVDTLAATSFSFNTVTAYLKSNQLKPNKFTFTYTLRDDKQAYQHSFVEVAKSSTYNLLMELLQNRKQQLRVNVTYRQLTIYNPTITTQKPDNTLLGRAEYVLNYWHGFVVGNALYELGSGQQQQLAITYVSVPAGQGQYAWIDYNKDGIQQLNEFEIAPFADQATFIRVYTPTNIYVKTDNVQFNYSVILNPVSITNKLKNNKLKTFIDKINLQSSLQSGRKVQAQSSPSFNPLGGQIADTALVTLKYIFTNTLSFNRTSNQWGLDISRVLNYNKSLLTYGLQSNEMNEWGLKLRVNIKRVFTIDVTQKLGNNNLLTPSFTNQNYAIKTLSTEPRLTYTNSTRVRFQASYNYSQKDNSRLYGGEKAVSNALSVDAKYNAVQNTSITTKFTLNNISYTGEANTTNSYVMLEGLLPGKNYLWNLSFTKRLINNLEISISYEGRKPGDAAIINTGRASLRALL